MALSATIFRGTLAVSDLDRNHFETHALTVARHPSETDERMMVRILAFAWAAGLGARFGPGLSETDAPDLFCSDATGRITLWIEVGLPDGRQIARALARADRVAVFAYGRSIERWWKEIQDSVPRRAALTVFALAPSDTQPLARLAERTMTLYCTIQEGQLWFGTEGATLTLDLRPLE